MRKLAILFSIVFLFSFKQGFCDNYLEKNFCEEAKKEKSYSKKPDIIDPDFRGKWFFFDKDEDIFFDFKDLTKVLENFIRAWAKPAYILKLKEKEKQMEKLEKGDKKSSDSEILLNPTIPGSEENLFIDKCERKVK
jgi:hypothetical protein